MATPTKQASQAAWYWAHRDQERAKRRAYYQAHKAEQAERNTRRYQEKRDEILLKTREYTLRTKYGITPEEYDRMLTAQGGVCAVCSKPPGKRRLHIDHNHSTGEVRALLCDGCNLALGLVHENEEVLLALVDYLRRFKQRKAA